MCLFPPQDFEPPKRPFRRMNYSDAIVWLKEHNIKKDDGSYYEFGEVTTAHTPKHTRLLTELSQAGFTLHAASDTFLISFPQVAQLGIVT